MAGRGRGKANTLPAWMTGAPVSATPAQPSAASYGKSIAAASSSSSSGYNNDIDESTREKNRQAAESFIKSFQFIRFPTAVMTSGAAVGTADNDRKKRRFSDNGAAGNLAEAVAAAVPTTTRVVHKLPSQEYVVHKPVNQTVIHMAYPASGPVPPRPLAQSATQISQGYLHYYAAAPPQAYAADPVAHYHQQQQLYYQQQQVYYQQQYQQQQQPRPLPPPVQYDFSAYYQQQQQQQQQQQPAPVAAASSSNYDWYNQSVKAALPTLPGPAANSVDDIAAKKSSLMQFLSDDNSSSSSSNIDSPGEKLNYITSFSSGLKSKESKDTVLAEEEEDDDGDDDTLLPMFKRIRKGCKVSCKYKSSILLADVISVMHKGYTNCVCDVKFDGYEKILTVPIDDITYIMKFPPKPTKSGPKSGVTAADCISAVSAGKVIDPSILSRGSNYWKQ